MAGAAADLPKWQL
jgi:hypothetical protein